MTRVWLLNLDADRELAAQGGYQTSRKTAAQIDAQRTRLEGLTHGEVSLPYQAFVDQRPEAPSRLAEHGAESQIVCWCPTPNARSLLAEAGLKPSGPAPALEILRHTNDRRFVLTLGGGAALPGRKWVAPQASLAFLDELPPVGDRWRLKRAFGFAGKGQRTVGRALSREDRKWLDASLRGGGFLREPNVQLVEEFALHGWVDADALLFGNVCHQEATPSGAIRRIEPHDPPLSVKARLFAAAEEVAARLRALGYSGPFGVDAFTYRNGSAVELAPVSDVNARFTIGWSLGMGMLRETALRRHADLT